MENIKHIIKERVADVLKQARTEINTTPTESQIKAGNYKKGHINFNGFEITIENPKGSYRTGKDSKGKKWKTYMHNDYGYFTKTVGKDGDAIDVFLGPHLDDKIENAKVYPIDQYFNGKFDETKVMLGFRSAEEAKKAYLSNYKKDWKGFKYITEVDIETFKKWLYDGHRQRKPFAKYVSLNESYTPMDSNPLHKTFISFGTNELDYSKFLPITTMMHNNKPSGGIWAAELHDEGGSNWKDFIENEMNTKRWMESLQKHLIFKLSPQANIFVINGKQDLINLKRTVSLFRDSPIDYEDLQKKGYDGVFLSEIGNRALHSVFDSVTPNFNTWDIASICVFNPDVIEIIPENIIDFDKNMGDNGNPNDEEEWWYADPKWEPTKRDDIKNTQMNRMWRQNGNLNIEPDMSKYFNGKQLALMAQEHGNNKDAKIARSFKGTIKESTINITESKQWRNEKGEKVPTKCNCGGNIELQIHGEPVYICTECGKYYGTLPRNLNEGKRLYITEKQRHFLMETIKNLVEN